MQSASPPHIREIDAAEAWRLRAPMRAAILAAAGGRLRRVRRGFAASGHPAPISSAIVDDLIRRGLLSGGPISAGLTQTGKWYARTLARALALQPQPNDEALA